MVIIFSNNFTPSLGTARKELFPASPRGGTLMVFPALALTCTIIELLRHTQLQGDVKVLCPFFLIIQQQYFSGSYSAFRLKVNMPTSPYNDKESSVGYFFHMSDIFAKL